MNGAKTVELLKLPPRTAYRFISDKRFPVIKTSARCVRSFLATFLFSLNTVTQPAEIISTNTSIETRGGLKKPSPLLSVGRK
jgi:hypothetical protein